MDICIEKSGYKTFPKEGYTVLEEIIAWAHSQKNYKSIGFPSDWMKL